MSLRRPWLILALIVALLVVGFLVYRHTAARQPQSAPTTSFAPKTCGDTTLTTVTIGRGGKGIRRQVATFYPWQCPSKNAPCAYAGASAAYPDPACNPGAIYDLTGNTDPSRYDEAANLKLICSSTTDGRRLVADRLKKKAFAQYGVGKHAAGSYEVDHIVSLTLGGSNVSGNLYPEPAAPTPGFHQKDAVEAELGRAICRGTLSLHGAQDIIAHSWTTYYTQHGLSSARGSVS